MEASSLDVASGSAHGLITGMDVLTAFELRFGCRFVFFESDLSRPGPVHGLATGMNDFDRFG